MGKEQNNHISTIRKMIEDVEVSPSPQNEGDVIKLEQAVKKLANKFFQLLSGSFESCDNNIAIANGRKLSQEELDEINKNDYDLIFNISQESLLFRREPENHSKLEEADLTGLEARRLIFLKYLLEHPQRYVSVSNATAIANSRYDITSSNLTQTIKLIRKSMCQKPSESYIITRKKLFNKYSRYELDSKWNYLLIKPQFLDI